MAFQLQTKQQLIDDLDEQVADMHVQIECLENPHTLTSV